ncbi:TPA: carbohydrate kinase, partial [Serratia marcescens]|nr:carbohydrate kinase [Serratia marcescens]
MSVFLGIDVGGTVIKAGLYRASGEELAIAERDGAAIAAQPGFSERNMDALWDDVCA